MSGFNPNANGVLGVEWPVTVESAYAVDSPSKAMGAALVSSGAESIDKQSVYVDAVSGTAKYVMEVRPVTATESPDVSTSTFRPNEDVVETDLFLQTGVGATVGTSYPAIDDSTLDLTDFLEARTYPNEWAGRVAAGSGNLTSKQILTVRLHYVVKTVGDPTFAALFYATLNIGGVKYTSPFQNADATQRELTFEWEYNPSTGLPWTIADIEAFDVSDEIGFITSGAGSNYTRIYQGWMEVDHVPEQRVAVGGTTISTIGWTEFNLSTPTAGTSYSKANTTEYVTSVRRLYGTGTCSFRYLDSLADAPNGHHGYAVQFSGADGRLLELGAEFTRAFSLLLTTTAPATSADSQPYVTRTLAGVYSGHNVESEFTGVAANYGVVKLVVAAQAGLPSADLHVKIRNRTGGTQIGTTMVFTPAELTGTPTALREITLMMAAAALPAAQCYIEVTSAAPNGEGWVVVVLDTTGTGSSATFGGTSNVATVGGVEDNDTDVAFVVAQIPTAPTNLAVTTEVADNGHEYIRATWDQTGLSANFDHYELERNDSDEGWQTIAKPTTELVEEFDDYESRRGIEASYRLRVVHVNGIASAYTATASGTAG